MARKEKERRVKRQVRFQLLRRRSLSYYLTPSLGKKDKKGKKGKKDKDPTSNRSIEDLWEELVKMEIIIPTKDIHLKDFVGDYSFLGGFSNQESDPGL